MEFELEPKESYYGTYTDRIITGSLLAGTRGLVGSAVSGSTEYTGAFAYSTYLRAKANPDYRSSVLRGVSAINSSKLFYDSVMPDFTEIYRLNGGQFIAPVWDEQSWIADNGSDEAVSKLGSRIVKMVFSTRSALTGSLTTRVSDSHWFYEHPFMQKYAGVQRRASIDKIPAVTTYDETGDPISKRLTYPAPTTSTTSSVQYSVAFAAGSNDEVFTVDSYYDRSYSPTVYAVEETGATATKRNLAGLTSRDLLVTMFGFGVSALSSSIDLSTFSGNAVVARSFGVQIQGWRYGVMSGIPMSPRAVFRIGRFGQLRDMLEPRLYSKTIDQKTKTIDGPISILFITGTQAALTASNPSLNPTDSGIYDSEYRCGQPFVDQ